MNRVLKEVIGGLVIVLVVGAATTLTLWPARMNSTGEPTLDELRMAAEEGYHGTVGGAPPLALPLETSTLTPEDVAEFNRHVVAIGGELILERNDVNALILADTNVEESWLVEIPRLPKCANLSLSNTVIGDRGMVVLEKLPGLMVANFRKTAISDKAVPTIAALPKLAIVDLRDTNVTKDGIAALKSLRPRLIVLSH